MKAAAPLAAAIRRAIQSGQRSRTSRMPASPRTGPSEHAVLPGARSMGALRRSRGETLRLRGLAAPAIPFLTQGPAIGNGEAPTFVPDLDRGCHGVTTRTEPLGDFGERHILLHHRHHLVGDPLG